MSEIEEFSTSDLISELLNRTLNSSQKKEITIRFDIVDFIDKMSLNKVMVYQTVINKFHEKEPYEIMDFFNN